MWALVNRTSFPAERAFLRDENGAEVLVVVVKATFELATDGATRVADRQEEIRGAPVHVGDPTGTSLLAETDLGPAKPATDVVLVGVARAPAERSVIAMEVGLRVGPLAKRIAVVGDRTWDRHLGAIAPGDPASFHALRLDYEHTYGGRDGDRVHPENPVGIGFATTIERLVGRPAPNLVSPDDLGADGARRAPRGFGPVARAWQPRLGLAGTFDAAWEAERMPLLPIDHDPRFAQCAPVDQQVAGLRGGAPFALEGFFVDGARRGLLPQLAFEARARFASARVARALVLHTVRFDTEAQTVALTYHVAIPCHRTLHALHEVVVREVRRG